MKRIIVVGLGSMGKRRIRLLQQMDSSLLICGVDEKPDRRAETADQYGISCFSSVSEAVAEVSPGMGLVCTSPLPHRAIITDLLQRDMHVFTELNLISDGYEEMIALSKKKGKVLFLSSPFLYRRDVQYLISHSREQPVNYMIHTGQYLPDWHPWENYQDFFVHDVRTNACREIMAVDLPWILTAFGRVTDLHVRKSKNSSLDLNYEDNYILSMEHESGSKGVFVCDLLSRKGGRSAEIISENMYLSWQGTPDSLTRWDPVTGKMAPVTTYTETLDHQAAYASNIIENAYREELETFFRAADRTAEIPYTFEDDLYTVGLIDRIEGRS